MFFLKLLESTNDFGSFKTQLLKIDKNSHYNFSA
jgi:hypothetical protein